MIRMGASTSKHVMLKIGASNESFILDKNQFLVSYDDYPIAMDHRLRIDESISRITLSRRYRPSLITLRFESVDQRTLGYSQWMIVYYEYGLVPHIHRRTMPWRLSLW